MASRIVRDFSLNSLGSISNSSSEGARSWTACDQLVQQALQSPAQPDEFGFHGFLEDLGELAAAGGEAGLLSRSRTEHLQVGGGHPDPIGRVVGVSFPRQEECPLGTRWRRRNPRWPAFPAAAGRRSEPA